MVFGCDGNHSTVRRLHFGQEALYSHFLRTYFSVAILDDLVIEPQTTRITNAPGVTMLVNSYDTTTDLVLGFRSEQEIPFDHHDEAAQKRILREHMLQAGSPFSDHVDEAIGAETFYFDKLSQIKMPSVDVRPRRTRRRRRLLPFPGRRDGRLARHHRRHCTPRRPPGRGRRRRAGIR